MTTLATHETAAEAVCQLCQYRWSESELTGGVINRVAGKLHVYEFHISAEPRWIIVSACTAEQQTAKKAYLFRTSPMSLVDLE